MLKREGLKPGMKVEENQPRFPYQRTRTGVIRSDPHHPEQILVSANGDLSMIPVLITDALSLTYDWWALSSFKVVE